MSSRNNRDIRGFFKSAGTSKSQPQKQQPASSSLSDLPPSPRTPQKSAPRVFRRDEEIKGSDDSEDDSDDSLGSITDALGYRTGPAAHQHDPNVLCTPQAKRIASGIHRSPLTIQPKKHKFDLKALISHSKEIERTEESFRKADALIAQTGRHSDNSDDSDGENDPKRLDEASCKLFVDPDDEDGKGDKIRRAFKRSKNDDASSRKHCYFFNQEEPPPILGKNAFPRKKATGRWKCLTVSDDARRRAFVMGLPHTFIAMGETLPDEIFLWILDEIFREKNAELRGQYINITELCDDNVSRLVDEARLYALLVGIGGPEYTREPTKLKGTTDVRQEYLERNWSFLVAFLQLLDRIAPSLQAASVVSAVQLLLRMSMDPIVAAVVRDHYTRTITILVSNLAESKSNWDIACDAICSYIYENIDDLELKVTILLSIPSSSIHLVDLRRRIAAESLFNKPRLGSKPIDSSLSFERIRDRLDEDDFNATNRVDFDFERLRALTTLLDIVIDRADFMRPATANKTSTPNATPRASPSPEDATAEQNFNAEVDVLATRVKTIHDKIRDKASRKNVKLSLLSLEKRLKYAVRTRPPPKREIFAFEGRTESEINVPKQRDFMRQWAQKKKAERQDVEANVVETAEFTGGRRGRRGAKGVSVAVG